MNGFIGPYQLIELIGQGSFGQVWKCCHRMTGMVYACKVINIRTVKEDSKNYENFKNELTANSHMVHPGIVRFYDIQCTLENLVRSTGGISEQQAMVFFRQIMEAIEYIHNQNYAHRDITLRNILIAADGSAKLADFGLCKRKPLSNLYTTMCGTFVYTAPEIITGQQYDGFSVDIWSAGICLYSMVSNHLPWIIDDNTPPDLILSATTEQICSGNIIYDDTMSEELKDLLSMILTVNPNDRPCPNDILSHPWFQIETEHQVQLAEPDRNLVNLIQSLIVQLDRYEV